MKFKWPAKTKEREQINTVMMALIISPIAAAEKMYWVSSIFAALAFILWVLRVIHDHLDERLLELRAANESEGKQ